VIAPPARIPLGGEAFALVDAEDLPLVADKTWHLAATGYARHSYRVPGTPRGNVSYLMMHYVIGRIRPGGLSPGIMVDHRNRVRTDNRKENLRLTLRTGNSQNQTSPNQKRGGFKGVVWHKRAQKWEAAIKHGGTRHYLGLFEDAIEAALNFPDQKEAG
jgi:hypothetical protein